MTQTANKKAKVAGIVLVYPFALTLIGVATNLILGIHPFEFALPDQLSIAAFLAATLLLLVTHSWLMTSTELVRVRFGLSTTPEEWAVNEQGKSDAPQASWDALERRHNAHRNLTENTVYFFPLAALMLLSSATDLVVCLWILMFGIARLGHALGYLTANTGLRGLFMSLSLLSLYGMASYLLIGVIL